MTDVTYEIVQHNGGWAYKLGDVFSETFETYDEARFAAERAAKEQERPGETGTIEYQDEKGRWHEELEEGSNRPHTHVSETTD